MRRRFGVFRRSGRLLTSVSAVVLLTFNVLVAVVVAPPAAACPAGTYEAASGDCVESPNGSYAGASAICQDGTASHSQTRSGTCSRHGGVAQWCPCGAPPPATPLPVAALPAQDPSQLIATGGDDQYVALAISPVTAQIGWGTANTQGRADGIANAECVAASGAGCQVAAEMHNGCVAIVLTSSSFQGGNGVTSAEAVMAASSRLPGGRVAALQCSK
ncbi:DUF3761 domain-containing protein [Mycolicibacterium grossiae]|nr:DUF3761 domain-containing protein [Mycolicibacterium grossiae]